MNTFWINDNEYFWILLNAYCEYCMWLMLNTPEFYRIPSQFWKCWILVWLKIVECFSSWHAFGDGCKYFWMKNLNSSESYLLSTVMNTLVEYFWILPLNTFEHFCEYRLNPEKNRLLNTRFLPNFFWPKFWGKKSGKKVLKNAIHHMVQLHSNNTQIWILLNSGLTQKYSHKSIQNCFETLYLGIWHQAD